MKWSVFGIFTVGAILALTSTVAASPVETELIQKRTDGPDVWFPTLIDDCKATDLKWNTTASECYGHCSTSIIQSWCGEIVDHCKSIIKTCQELPEGYIFEDLGLLCGLIYALLIEIQCTLLYLCKACGLVGIVSALLTVLIPSLFSTLTTLLTCLNTICPGVLDCVIGLLNAVGCLICDLISVL